MARTANRQEVGKILTASGPVLDSWKMFAGQMGLESADIKGIERDLLTKSIKLSEVFDEVLAVAEVRLKPCNIASVKKALVWMGYKGVEEELDKFGDDAVITGEKSKNPVTDGD